MATRKANHSNIRTGAQNSRMWALASELRSVGLSKADADEVLHDICENIAGHRRTSHLTVYQAEQVIHQLKETVERSRPPSTDDQVPERVPWGPRGPGPREKVILTPSQQAHIQALFVQAGMETTAQQRAFCQRQTGKPWPQSKTESDALIEPLKAIIKRANPAAKVRDRFKAVRSHPALDRWKTDFVDDVCERFEKTRDISKVVTPYRLRKLEECEAAVARSQ